MAPTQAELSRAIRATLMPGFAGFTVPGWIKDALDDGLVSVCVYGGNVRDEAQLKALGRELRAHAPKSLIAIDEEGGEVTRLHYLTGAPYPGAAILGRIDDEATTEATGRRVARDIQAAGFNFALAPDADVNSNPENPVIGTRSFSSDPQIAAKHVAAWVRGLQGAGGIASPKHFPGHGDTAQDSHLELPRVEADLDTIVARDLPPFQAAIDAGALAIMTSHIVVPAIDAAQPATFSTAVLQGLLRERLGFTGLIVTDALDMAGASGEIGIPEAAVRALAAGCDLLCLGTDTGIALLDEIERHVAQAVEDGRLPAERVLEAAGRVRALSDAQPATPVVPDPETADTSAEIALVEASFDGRGEAAAWLAAHPGATVLRVESEANMAVGFAPWGPFAAVAHPLAGSEAAVAAFAAREQLTANIDAAAPWNVTGATIVVGRDLHRHAASRAEIDRLRGAGIPLLIVEMGWPEQGSSPSYSDVRSYGSSALAGAALLSLLKDDKV